MAFLASACCQNIKGRSLDKALFIHTQEVVRRSHQLLLVLARSCGVAIRVEEHLWVAVDRHKGFYPAMRLNKVHDGLDLRLGVSSRPRVRLWTRVITSAGTCRSKWIFSYLFAGVFSQPYHTHCVYTLYLVPPNPASQFLLGSTPTQTDPEFGFLVLRHIRFCIRP